jgi:hypothetical protein
MSGTNYPNGIKTRVDGVDKTITGNPTIAAVTATDAAAAAGANPTKAEYDVAVTELNSCKAQLNLVIATLKTAGIIL